MSVTLGPALSSRRPRDTKKVMNRRKLKVVHYHIYKNSGTSFEQVLDDNYGDRHLKIDGPFAFSHITQDQLANIIEQHPLS